MPSGTNWDKIGRDERARRNGTVSIFSDKIWKKKKKKKNKQNPTKTKTQAPPKPLTELEKRLIRKIEENTRKQLAARAETLRKRKLRGVGAKDSLWFVEHSEPYNYADLLGRFWEFNQDGIASFAWKRISRAVVTKQCEYCCLGFPAIIVNRLRQQIENQKGQEGLSISQIEKKLIETLSNISTRHRWTFMPGGILRQNFVINRKALNRAVELNPAFFSYL